MIFFPFFVRSSVLITITLNAWSQSPKQRHRQTRRNEAVTSAWHQRSPTQRTSPQSSPILRFYTLGKKVLFLFVCKICQWKFSSRSCSNLVYPWSILWSGVLMISTLGLITSHDIASPYPWKEQMDKMQGVVVVSNPRLHARKESPPLSGIQSTSGWACSSS